MHRWKTRWDPLLLPSREVDGRWTVDAWALLDGRVINGGARFTFYSLDYHIQAAPEMPPILEPSRSSFTG